MYLLDIHDAVKATNNSVLYFHVYNALGLENVNKNTIPNMPLVFVQVLSPFKFTHVFFELNAILLEVDEVEFF